MIVCGVVVCIQLSSLLQSKNKYKILVQIRPLIGLKYLVPYLKWCADNLSVLLTSLYNGCLPDEIMSIIKREPGKGRQINCTSVMPELFERLPVPQFVTDFVERDAQVPAQRFSSPASNTIACSVSSTALALDRKCKTARIVFTVGQNFLG